MNPQFFLIDFENVQLKNIGLLAPGACRIKVFLGQSQSKLLLELVQALQPFGADAEYIQISGSGSNALDFHIAFYIGRLASEYPDASFTIVSRDTGFDPLVKHLIGLKIQCRRVATIAGGGKSVVTSKSPATKSTPKVPVVAKSTRNVGVTVKSVAKSAPTAKAVETTATRVTEVVKRLKGLKAAKPAKLATLESSVKSWFKPALQTKDLASVIQSLTNSKKIQVNGNKVTYTLG